MSENVQAVDTELETETETETETEGQSCATCSGDKPEPFLGFGQISVRLTSASTHREFEYERAALSKSSTEVDDLVKIIALRKDLSRQVCWIFAVQGIEQFILIPRTDAELSYLIEVLSDQTKANAETIAAISGWVTGSQSCGGVELPTILVENVYHFEINKFVSSMLAAAGAEKKVEKELTPQSIELFNSMLATGANNGMDGSRAMNWMLLRFAPFYQLVLKALSNDMLVTSVSASAVIVGNSGQKITEVYVVVEPRKYGVSQKYKIIIDVSDLYPFQVNEYFQQFF